MLHLRKKDKKQDEQVIFIQVAFFAVGAVLLLSLIHISEPTRH